MLTLIQAHHRVSSRQNAKTWANQFRARLLEPGIVSYEDQDCGKALLSKETIDTCIRSFIGRPLILTRDRNSNPTYTHAKVSPGSLENMADGYISDVQYDNADGWWYAVGTVHDEEAKKAIQEIGLVSCAYDVKSCAPGGSYHNIPFDEEITAFEGEHLAIVASPRYERATIRLNAKTKSQPAKHMFKWIKNALASKPEASSGTLPEGAALEIDGAQVAVSDLVATHRRVNSTDGEELDGSSEILIGTDRVSIDTLIASHQKLNAKKKNADEDKEDKEDKEDEKENELPEEFKKEKKKDNASDKDESKENTSEEDEKENDAAEEDDKSKKQKKNSVKTFRVNGRSGPLSRARENGFEVETMGHEPDTRESRLARGNDRYGPKNVTPTAK